MQLGGLTACRFFIPTKHSANFTDWCSLSRGEKLKYKLQFIVTPRGGKCNMKYESVVLIPCVSLNKPIDDQAGDDCPPLLQVTRYLY